MKDPVKQDQLTPDAANMRFANTDSADMDHADKDRADRGGVDTVRADKDRGGKDRVDMGGVDTDRAGADQTCMGRVDVEIPLIGGNVAGSVVRVGGTVRKPAGPATPAIEALLVHLADAGFDGAPRTLGRDPSQRHVLEYIPGSMADGLAPMTLGELGRTGQLIRAYHDAVATFRPPADAGWQVLFTPDRVEQTPGGVLICHNDLAPWNLVRDGERWVFIDWDSAAPGSRLWDLAYAAHGFVPLSPGGDPGVDAPRLRAFVDGYGLDEQERRALPPLIADRTRAMYNLLRSSAETGAQPWSRLYAEGHGNHWGPATSYIEQHLDVWTNALLSD